MIPKMFELLKFDCYMKKKFSSYQINIYKYLKWSNLQEMQFMIVASDLSVCFAYL